MPQEWEYEMTNKLKNAPYGDKNKIIQEYQSLTGKSPQTLHAVANRHGYKSGRKKRSDAGECRLSDEQISYISGLIYTSRREIKGAILPVEDALQVAEDNGIIEKGCISVPRLQAILRERGQNAAALNAPAPHTPMRSLHPNHVHLFDVSVCIQYYLRKGGMRIVDERRFYKNKPQNFQKIKKRMLRYVLVDHFSGAIFVKYYYAGGETSDILFRFLCDAWGGGKHEKLPFRGVPFFVLMDAGAANTSKSVLSLLERLDIKLPKAMPHNPRRQGAVERAQQIVETKFESKLRFQPAHTMGDLNAWALDWCIWFNATARHTRHGMTRLASWLTIREEQLRELPDTDLLREMFTTPEVSRRVNGRYAISFKGKEYDVRHIKGLIPGRSNVSVILRPFSFPEIGVIYNGEEYVASPVGTVSGGFRKDAAIIGQEYKQMPESRTQQEIKKAENLAYGDDAALPETKRRKKTPFAGTKVFGHQADKVKVTPMPRRGTALAMTREVSVMADRQISIMDLMRRLRPVLGDISPELNQAIRRKYGKSVSLAETDRLLTAAADGTIYEKMGTETSVAEIRTA